MGRRGKEAQQGTQVLLEYRRRWRGTPGSASPRRHRRCRAIERSRSLRGASPPRTRESSAALRGVTEGVGEGNERVRKGIYSLGFFRWADLGRRSAWAELIYNINEIIQLSIPFSFYFRMKILQLKLHLD